MDAWLSRFIVSWIWLVLALNVVVAGLLMAQAPTVWAGISDNPFNTANFMVEAALLSPAVAAYFWRERLRHD
jgi:hypothetical protein